MGYCVIHDYSYPDLADEDFCPYCKAPEGRRLPRKPELKTALKYNKGKLRIRLCPPFVKEMMINALEFGCTKYFENSWRKGFMVADMYDATNRHLDAFFHEREDIDKESGCHHLDCALFSLAMMKYSVVLEGKDNRPPVTPEQIEEVIRLGMIEIQKREVEENDDN